MKLEVKVHAGASRDQVEVEGPRAEVWTKAKPKKGKANLAVLKLLADHFDVPSAHVRLVAGRTSRKKIVIIPD